MSVARSMTKRKRFNSVRRNLTRNWPAYVTILALVTATAAWIFYSETRQLEAVGSYISGIVAAVTLLWLAVGQRNQLAELSMQREELALQRIAAQQQAQELHNSARIAIMTQVQSLIDDALKVVEESEVVNSEADLTTAYMKAIENFKEIEESKDPKRVIAAFNEWLKVESTCKRYLNCIATAMRLHQEFNSSSNPLPKVKESYEIVFVYSSWFRDAPFISNHLGIATLLSQLVMVLEPGAKRAHLAAIVAHVKVIEVNIMKDGALDELRTEILEYSNTLPAICEPWPISTKS